MARAGVERRQARRAERKDFAAALFDVRGRLQADPNTKPEQLRDIDTILRRPRLAKRAEAEFIRDEGDKDPQALKLGGLGELDKVDFGQVLDKLTKWVATFQQLRGLFTKVFAAFAK